MLRPLVALALVLATPAFAQTYGRTDIIRGLCRPDGCVIYGSDFQIQLEILDTKNLEKD